MPATLLLPFLASLAAVQDPAAPQTLLSVERWTPERLRSVLVPRERWRPFPTVGDPGLSAVPEAQRRAQIAAGEERLGQPWPSLPASLFLEYVRDGNRSRYQAACFERRNRLATLVLAELFEGQGRFLGDVVDGVWLVCEETYWGVPAHVGAQRAGEGLPDVEEPTVDLFAAETGALLAWTHHLLGPRLDDVSPLVRPRIEHEVERRILAPCRERDDFWWMGFGGRSVNNWNPWICSNWLSAVLLLEGDEEQRVADVARVVRVLDHFVAGYPPDGGCDEGPGYWNRAAASLFDCLALLRDATGGALDAFDAPLVGEMGRFIQRVCIADEWFVNFADAAPRVTIDAPLVYRYGRAIGDPSLAAFAAAAARRQGLGQGAVGPQFGSLGRVLPALLVLPELLATEPAVALPREVWLPHLQVMLAREAADSTRGFTVAAKGGHNGESHNHNDVGNVIVFHDGAPVLVDAGVGTYTRQTFSARRYELWTMQSAYHNLPSPNGVRQAAGARWRAREARFDSSADVAELRLDLAGAYPEAAGLAALVRTVTLDRGQEYVVVSDEFRFARVSAPSSWSLLTPRRVEVRDGILVLEADATAPVELRVYPTSLAVEVEPLPLEDAKLRHSWPEGLSRVVLTWEDPPEEGDVAFVLSR